jgi:para-aminobenzoate synthetase component 1
MHTFNLPHQKNSSIWFDQIINEDAPVYLDSCFNKKIKVNDQNRFDIIACNPFIKVEQRGKRTQVVKEGVSFLTDESFSSIIDILHAEYAKIFHNTSDLPFTGGFIGYLSYEFHHNNNSKNQIPVASANAYKSLILVDHLEQKTFFISHEDKKIAEGMLEQKISFIKEKQQSDLEFKVFLNTKKYESFDSYCKKFDRIQNYIKDGDVYQVNLATKFSLNFSGDSWKFYKKLKDINQSPFMAYFRTNDFSIISGSPEQFIKIENDKITSRPIKGTIARGVNDALDKINYDLLRNSDKDKAENLMIVDLIRNDLGRNAKVGSIKVNDLFKIESYPNVHHMVSTIEGELKKDTNAWMTFCDIFPGGSITGAPKKRAIEIIDELEDFARDVYCGSIFYNSFSGNFNSNIAIRTVVARDNEMYFYSGGGITKNSEADKEFQEIQDKASNIEKVLSFFNEENI